MGLFSRKPNYVSLLNDIRKIELSNENIDSKTSIDKLELLRVLKKNIENSGILKYEDRNNNSLIIKEIYHILYFKQGTFDGSFYETLSLASSNPKKYLELAKSYESFLSEKLFSLRNLIQTHNSSDNQSKIYNILSSKAGLIKTSMLALMLSVSAMSCDVSSNGNLVLRGVNSGGHNVEYVLDKQDMETYIIKNGKSIDEKSELAYPILVVEGYVTLPNGSKEVGMSEVYTYHGEKKPYIIVSKSYDGKIVSITLNKNSPFYNKLKNRFGDRLLLVK